MCDFCERLYVLFQKLYLISVFTLTFLFAITWQFAQFILLLESLVLFGLAVLQIIDHDKV